MKPKSNCLQWNSDLAWVVGFFASDGSMYINPRGSRYVSFTSTDKSLIQYVKNILDVQNKIEVYQRPGNYKLRYVLQIGNKILYQWFLDLGFTQRKSLTLELPKIPKAFFADFVRGFFDGDGNVYYKKGKRYYLLVVFRCGSQNFINDLRTLLSNSANLGPGSMFFHSRAYSLAYSARDVVKLYHFLYPSKGKPCLIRKRLRWEEGLKFLGS